METHFCRLHLVNASSTEKLKTVVFFVVYLTKYEEIDVLTFTV